MELHYKSISEIGALLRAGKITALELTDHMLARIDRLNPKLNAFITVTPELARHLARVADREWGEGIDRGPLHGIPVAVKDLFATKGIRTTSGSKLFESHVPDFDATAVTRLRQAGATLLGKTGMHELAAGTTGHNPFFGDIHNPWKAGFDPGGSSGGSASAVAARLAFAALGTDTGCSVREPAHCCGIVGFKPTFGVVSKYGVQPLVWTLDHVGPLARSVEDAATVFAVIAGHDPKDAYSETRMPPAFDDALVPDLSAMRIGVIRRYFFDCDSEIDRAVNAALDLLRQRGARIIELDPPDLENAFSVAGTSFAEAGAIYEDNLRNRPDCFSDQVRTSLRASLAIEVTRYTKAQEFRRGFRTRVEALFDRVDVLIAPTSRRVPAELAKLADITDWADGYRQDVWKNTSVFNLTGHPSISLPCGVSSAGFSPTGLPLGLPVGLMVTGPLFADNRLLRCARIIEETIDWSDRPPGI